MLYDPKWEAPAQAVSLQDFIGWLETKDPHTTYEFSTCGGECLIGQYMAARDRKWGYGLYGSTCTELFGKDYFWEGISVLSSHPETFGGALSRARKFAAQ